MWVILLVIAFSAFAIMLPPSSALILAFSANGEIAIAIILVARFLHDIREISLASVFVVRIPSASFLTNGGSLLPLKVPSNVCFQLARMWSGFGTIAFLLESIIMGVACVFRDPYGSVLRLSCQRCC